MSNGECQCPDAVKWRTYWTHEAIAARLAEELRPYQIAWQQAMADVQRDLRGWRRIYVGPDWTAADMAESKARAAYPGPNWDR